MHALDEEELKLRKKREQPLLETEIAEEMAKLSVLKSQSSVVKVKGFRWDELIL